jgi:hypothetical protein
MPPKAKSPEVERITATEFARRAGCGPADVRTAIRKGKLKRDADFLMDASQLSIPFLRRMTTGAPIQQRQPKANRQKADPPLVKMGTVARKAASPKIKEGETPEEAANRIVNNEERAPYDRFEAERIKENYLALLRQLEYDLKSGEVVAIADVHAAVALEYGIIRSRLLSVAAEIAPRVSMMTTAAEVKDFLEAQISKVLEDLTLDRGDQPDVTVGAIRKRTGRIN